MTKLTNRLLSVLAILIATSPVALAAASPETREDKERAARKACLTGDVGKGIDLLADLFVEHKEIVYIFNQARCFQQNHRWQEALDRFSEYQRKAGHLPADQQAELDQYIADCKAHLQPGQPPAAPPLPPPASAQPVHAPFLAPFPGLTATSPPPPAGRGLRVAGIVAGVVGVAAVATGIVMAAKTKSLSDDVLKHGYDRDKLSSRDTYETLGWVSYGVGAAGIVGGTVLYLWGRSAGTTPSRQLSFLPVVGPAGAGVVLEGGL